MKVVQVEVPAQLAGEMSALIEGGWFTSEQEIARRALIEFVHRHRFELIEQFQRDDIAWALKQRNAER